MKILITGHLGFIGTRLCKVLKRHKIKYDGFDLLDGNDIRNRLQLDKQFEAGQYDVVIHMAALAGVRRGQEFPEEYISTNITGTQNVVDMCEKYGVDRLIFFSSSSVLGGAETGLGLDETYDLNPKSLYAVTKVTGEFMVNNAKIKSTIIRPFTVYGENGRKDMVLYKWINQIKANKPITVYGDGTSTRGYTYVGDLAQAIYDLLNKPYDGVMHIGGGEQVELNHILSEFQRHCGRRKIAAKILVLPMPKEDVRASFANCRVAEEHIGFNPEKRFIKILRKILRKEL